MIHREENPDVPLETEIHILNHRRLLLLRRAVNELMESIRPRVSDPSSATEVDRKRVSRVALV